MTTTAGIAAASADGRSVLKDPVRLNRIDELRLLDTPREPSLDRLTRMAANLLDTPIALLSIVDDDRQFFKSSIGLGSPLSEFGETSLTDSLCQHVVIDGKPFVVTDAGTDPRVGRIVLLGDVAVTAYLGVPISTSDGIHLGALCVIDDKPRHWSQHDLGVLGNVAELVVADIELRQSVDRLNAAREESRNLQATLGRSGQFQRSIIDTIDADVCIVDQTGTIIEANRSWLGFVDTFPTDPLAAQIGTDLFAEAGRADATRVDGAGPGASTPDLDDVLIGLRQVLADERCSIGGRYQPEGAAEPIAVRAEALRGAIEPMAIIFRDQRNSSAVAPSTGAKPMTSPFDL